MTEAFWVLHCRPGFEGECAAEAQAALRASHIDAYARAKAGAAHVTVHPHAATDPARLLAALRPRELVFSRQGFVSNGLLAGLPPDDRVAPIAAALADAPAPLGDLWVETPDTDAAKSLGRLARALETRLRAACVEAGTDRLRAHVLLLSGAAAYSGWVDPRAASPWPMGIPRLRFPRQAPSRSALKLEEALVVFLEREERAALLHEGVVAVDLGAAPGGWSWVLARHGVWVHAVDNGALAPQVAASGLVEHHRADGFRFRPAQPVEWLVCDMVEQPRRVAALVGDWIAAGLCRRAIFNLKLPMKRRLDEVRACEDLLLERCAAGGRRVRLRLRQLYHDREEVTGYVAPA